MEFNRLPYLIVVIVLAVSCSDDTETPEDNNTPVDMSRDQDRVRDTASLDTVDEDDPMVGLDASSDRSVDDEVNVDASWDDPMEDAEPTETSADDANGTDANEDEIFIAQNTRVAFQYEGSDGGSHYVDDILVSDSSSVVIDEGFESGALPEGWLLRVQQLLFSWEVNEGSSEAHAGTYSAKVTWYQNQDEWLVSPPINGDGSYTLTFWNKGFVDFSEQATLTVHFTCNDGDDWTELYVFPGPGETEGMVWYENTVEFECPATE